MEPSQTSKKKMSTGKKILIGVVVLFVLGLIGSQLDKDKNSNTNNTSSAGNSSSETATATTPAIGIGQPLKTEYFEVTISKADLTKKVNTGNEYSDVAAEPGNQFLIMTATFKNIDNESRMLMDGSVFINYNGKDYEFDKSEVVAAEGFGLFLDQINPLTSKTTKLVYKLPAEIKGPAYYKPGRASDDEKIFLGDLK
ncbi:DUF4352 domain-containing protein [Ferruginibacter sp. HRS2-29]|uniref:DUF4352 domain-containing protein n=1 Tax=Ferruginibacter sp. HRS2-29 TaxID=2487334 RepID=UPI0020CD12E2|nr:DUF4352 domain-containing protein [Ferruginibacter sp. HRS2-29]MCP9752350.1 DUF4352 domain-containing protein [Ferruginibacter sp. HRS2-29]